MMNITSASVKMFLLIFVVSVVVAIIVTGCAAAPALPAGHKASNLTSCLTCHGAGGTAPKVPANHKSYSDANEGARCLQCHK